MRGDKSVQNPLASLVVCAKCGRRMQRRPSNKNPDMLICAEPTCNNHASYLNYIEQHIIDVLKKWSSDYEIQKPDIISKISENDLKTNYKP